MIEQSTYWIIIYGVVQGVGFRPFIKRLAKELAIAGKVKNKEGSIHILATGSASQLSLFVEKIKECPPYGAVIDHLESIEIPTLSFQDFLIIDSKEELFPKDFVKDTKTVESKPFIHVGVDLPLCPDCERELYDKKSRRYGHPLISCVQCGPRYSIIKSLPYDRINTTMNSFPLCENCEREYHGMAGEEQRLRVHAQTISCHKCGPQLLFYINEIEEVKQKEKALLDAITALQKGGVIAVKGIGGYHFVCKPDCDVAVTSLRKLKHRDKKPFAVMFRSVEQLKDYCEVSSMEEQVLNSQATPIVILKRRNTRFVAKNLCGEVYGQNLTLGAFLPYTAIQCLLLDALGPLVFTSANLTDEPILWEDQSVLAIASKLDGILYHTRDIMVPMDDSVVQVVAGKMQVIRRARGYVPTAIKIGDKEIEQFAAGGDLKAVFGFYRDGEAYLSQYLGDLEQDKNYERYQWNYNHMKTLFRFDPKEYLVDYNPNYFSHKMTLKQIEEMNPLQSDTFPMKRVQHHHAHVASVMAEHKVHEVIGVAFDGTGLGEDKAVWGSEFFICREEHYERRGHLDYVSVVGYDNAAKNASVMAACYLHAARIKEDTMEYEMLVSAIESKINTIACSSMGRLFDAVAAILSLCQYNEYEGECAICLETAAMKGNKDRVVLLPFEIIKEGEQYSIDPREAIRTLYHARKNNENVNDLALSFHYGVAEMIRQMSMLLREETGLNAVALSGGVFVNRILLEKTMELLQAEGFLVYINEQVPCGDGGIALGQLYIGQWDK